MDYSRHRLPDRQIDRRGRTHSDHHESRTAFRSMNPRQVHDGSRHSIELSRHDDYRRRRSRKVYFNDAVNDLHDILRDGLRFYQGFKGDYERDIHRIKSYADQKLLDQIWKNKISMSGKRSSGVEGQRGRDSSRERDSQQTDVSFKSMAKDIYEGICSTMDATRNIDRSEDAENAKIVRSKLGQTYQDLMSKLELAPSRMRDTRLLITELEMLLTFLSHNGAEQARRGDTDEHRDYLQRSDPRLDDRQGREQYDQQGSGDERAEESY